MTDSVKKIAVIINGDSDSKHTKNVSDALDVLEGMGFLTFAASVTKNEQADHNFDADRASVDRMIADIQKLADADDEIVIYTTGHGQLEKGTPQICLDDKEKCHELAALLDGIAYGQRTVIMDQCYSGNHSKIFDDPKTLFIASGSQTELVCCQEFAGRFWAKNIADLNGDGVISWQERYNNALEGGVKSSRPQFLIGAGYAMAGRPPFEAKVVEVDTVDGLNEQLSRLAYGQYAAVVYSADWCGACKSYKPLFENMARLSGGQYLFIWAEGKSSGDEPAGPLSDDVVSTPTVRIIGKNREKYEVADRTKVLEEFYRFGLPYEELFGIRLKRLDDLAGKELAADIKDVAGGVASEKIPPRVSGRYLYRLTDYARRRLADRRDLAVALGYLAEGYYKAGLRQTAAKLIFEAGRISSTVRHRKYWGMVTINLFKSAAESGMKKEARDMLRRLEQLDKEESKTPEDIVDAQMFFAYEAFSAGLKDDARRLLKNAEKEIGAVHDSKEKARLVFGLAEAFQKTGDEEKSKELCLAALPLLRGYIDSAAGKNVEDAVYMVVTLLRQLRKFGMTDYACEQALIELGRAGKIADPVVRGKMYRDLACIFRHERYADLARRGYKLALESANEEKGVKKRFSALVETVSELKKHEFGDWALSVADDAYQLLDSHRENWNEEEILNALAILGFFFESLGADEKMREVRRQKRDIILATRDRMTRYSQLIDFGLETMRLGMVDEGMDYILAPWNELSDELSDVSLSDRAVIFLKSAVVADMFDSPKATEIYDAFRNLFIRALSQREESEFLQKCLDSGTIDDMRGDVYAFLVDRVLRLRNGFRDDPVFKILSKGRRNVLYPHIETLKYRVGEALLNKSAEDDFPSNQVEIGVANLAAMMDAPQRLAFLDEMDVILDKITSPIKRAKLKLTILEGAIFCVDDSEIVRRVNQIGELPENEGQPSDRGMFYGSVSRMLLDIGQNSEALPWFKRAVAETPQIEDPDNRLPFCMILIVTTFSRNAPGFGKEFRGELMERAIEAISFDESKDPYRSVFAINELRKIAEKWEKEGPVDPKYKSMLKAKAELSPPSEWQNFDDAADTLRWLGIEQL